MTTADTGAGLLRAVAADPADDTVRLAYADWLDENAGGAECRACLGSGSHALDPYELAARYGRSGAEKILDAAKCLHCGGSGRVSDGKRERAEFIRVQVELAAGGCLPGLCICTRRCDELRRRERELTGDRFECWADDLASLRPLLAAGGSAAYARGFVDEVRCRLDVLLGGACGRCGGRGELPGRGSHDSVPVCPDCGGTGRTPGVAADLFARHPVTRVVAVDKEPYLSPEAGYVWVRDCEDTRLHTDRPRLPHEVFANLPGASHGNYVVCEPNSVEGGQQMLSRALVAVCRARAELPELPR